MVQIRKALLITQMILTLVLDRCEMYDVSFNDYMPDVWLILLGGIESTQGIHNEIGVAALMGNLYAESGCTPYACQPQRPYDTCMTYIEAVNNGTISRNDFIHYGCSKTGGVASTQLGFGMAQWTYWTRKEAFYDWMFANGNDIGEYINQIDYILIEIQTLFPDVWDELINATDLDYATDYVLTHYENPKDKSLSVKKQRRQNASQIYSEYVGTPPEPVPDPQPPSPSSPIPYVNQQSKLPIWAYPCVRYKT